MTPGCILPVFLPNMGCPSRCIFCDQGRVTGAAGQIPTYGELSDMVGRWSTPSGAGVELAYYGGSFTLLPRSVQRRLLDAAARLRSEGRVCRVRLSTRPDAVDRETASFLSACGVDLVELGVQSFDPGVLNASGRGHSPEEAHTAAGHLSREGIRVGIHLMTGLPHDTPSRSLSSMRRALSLAPALVRIHPLIVLSGTPLARMVARGEFTPWDDATTVETVKRMYHAALRQGVPVARIGVQADRHLADGSAIAGFREPAAGELVRSALWGDLLRIVAKGGLPRSLVVTANPRSISSVAGHRRGNVRLLTSLGVFSVTFRADETVGEWTLVLEGGGRRVVADVLRDLNYDE